MGRRRKSELVALPAPEVLNAPLPEYNPAYAHRAPAIADAQVFALVIKSVRNGAPFKVAAQAAALQTKTIYLNYQTGKLAAQAREKGEKGFTLDGNEYTIEDELSIYERFYHEVNQARALFAEDALAKWKGAFVEDWRSIKEFLTHHPDYRDDFAPPAAKLDIAFVRQRAEELSKELGVPVEAIIDEYNRMLESGK